MKKKNATISKDQKYELSKRAAIWCGSQAVSLNTVDHEELRNFHKYLICEILHFSEETEDAIHVSRHDLYKAGFELCIFFLILSS